MWDYSWMESNGMGRIGIVVIKRRSSGGWSRKNPYSLANAHQELWGKGDGNLKLMSLRRLWNICGPKIGARYLFESPQFDIPYFLSPGAFNFHKLSKGDF